MTTTVHTSYVITDEGGVLVQGPHDSRCGFALYDEDQSWPGGIGVSDSDSWTAISDDDPRITAADRDRLSGVLEELRNSAPA